MIFFAIIILTVKHVATLPHGLLDFYYHLPSHVQIVQRWTLEHPEILSITIPWDAVEGYIAWDPTLKPIFIRDPMVTSTNTTLILVMSWWGDGFDIGVAFKSI